jgi:hypothetical protein
VWRAEQERRIEAAALLQKLNPPPVSVLAGPRTGFSY